jgi:predicted MPP superfamily phosphohydrolase
LQRHAAYSTAPHGRLTPSLAEDWRYVPMNDALVLLLWLVASAGHVTLFAALLNRLQGYAVPPRMLHPLEKALLAVIAAGPLLALFVVLRFDIEGPGPIPATFRLWAIVTSLFFFVWALGRLTVQVVRAASMGPVLRRRRRDDVPLDEALLRNRWTWRLATSIPGNEALKLNTIRTQIALPQATRPQERLRIVHLSDLHLTGTLSKAFYRRAIDAALAERPDAFFLTGDLVEAEECLDWIDELFRPLAEAAPTWFVLGNHDAYLPCPETLVERLEQPGLVSLMGRRERVELAGWRVELLGDSAPWFAGFPPAEKETPESDKEAPDLTLALMHTPDRWPAAKKLGADLALAGHTHGGQIRIPIFGPLFCPSRHGSRYSRGWFESRGKRMFVSQGVAGVIPVRFLCPPEVVRIDVLPAAEIELPERIDVQALTEANASD